MIQIVCIATLSLVWLWLLYHVVIMIYPRYRNQKWLNKIKENKKEIGGLK